MINAIIWKYGYKEGLSTRANKITEWGYKEPQPNESELKIIIAEYKEYKRYEDIKDYLVAARNNKINEGIIYKDKIIYTDKNSLGDITGSLLAASINSHVDSDIIEPFWKCKEDVLIDLTFSEMKEIGILARSLVQKAYLTEKIVINSLAGMTKEELSTMDVNQQYEDSFNVN
jgi:hypothetical protein